MRKNGLKNHPLPSRGGYVFQPRVHPVKESDDTERKGWGRWIFLFFAGGWLFFLGVYVGRITVPVYVGENPVEKAVAQIKQIEEKKNLQSGGKVLTETDLGFYESLRGRKAADGPPSSPSLSPKKRAEGQPEVKRPLSPKKPFQAASQTAEPKKTSAPSPSAASDGPSASHRYAIQVASFAQAKDADQMASKLKRKGYSGAYVTNDNIPGIGVRFRVKVGYYKTQSDARRPLEKLRLKERLTDAYIFKLK